jgi:hypothetical protein
LDASHYYGGSLLAKCLKVCQGAPILEGWISPHATICRFLN